ncbi:MAG TPA: SCP2 sterol-binding domain-containing protein [Acidimicrobiales bacterium]|jgi:hypothetical protein|nr:SCP2 sterol-binding domain-containing protein [Acidimicrobiales bacterium]
MPDLGTAEWAEAAGQLWSKLPPAPGASGKVSLGVSTAPRKEVTFHWAYQDGQVVSGGAGGGDAAATFTLGRADAPDVLSGAVSPSVAFMRGRLKASGDGGLILEFLQSTLAPGFEEWRAAIAGLAG